MVRYEDDCVGCPKEMGCLGNQCSYKNVPYYSCDRCGEDADVYIYNGEEICEDCLLDEIDKVSCSCCGYETDELYEYNGEILCEDCLLDKVTKATCSCCGEKSNKLYSYGGEILCKDCLLKDFEKLE